MRELAGTVVLIKAKTITRAGKHHYPDEGNDADRYCNVTEVRLTFLRATRSGDVPDTASSQVPRSLCLQTEHCCLHWR